MLDVAPLFPVCQSVKLCVRQSHCKAKLIVETIAFFFYLAQDTFEKHTLV